MSIIKTIAKSKMIPLKRVLMLYPPFLFMGVQIKEISLDYRFLHARLPLRWYGKNIHGTMFGGFMCALADPLPALMCGEIFSGYEIWTKHLSIDFLKPARGILDLKITITEQDISQIQQAIQSNGKTEHTFIYSYKDQNESEMAVIKGETAHFEFISLGATVGVMQAMLATGIPISFGILTTYTDEQAQARAGTRDGSLAHNKGCEAAAACLEMAESLSHLQFNDKL